MAQATVKRGRGRPKGVKNKPKPAAELDADLDRADQSTDDGDHSDEAPEMMADERPQVREIDDGLLNDSDRYSFGENEHFWTWMERFTPEEWQYLIAYLWRTMPKFDMKAAGRASGIDKFAAKFDMDQIKRTHGSGGYRIDFCRIHPKTRKNSRITSHYFEIVDVEHPPKLPYGEWVKYPDNANWIWGHLTAPDGSPEAVARETASSPITQASGMFQLVSDVIKLTRPEDAGNATLINTLASQLSDAQRQLLTQLDPARQLEMMRTYLSAFAPQKDTSIIDFLREDMRAMREEMKYWRDRAMVPTPTPADPLSQLAEVVGKLEPVMSTLGYKRGGSGAAAATPPFNWGEVIKDSLQMMSPHIGGFISWLNRPAPRQPATVTMTPGPSQVGAPAAQSQQQPPEQGQEGSQVPPQQQQQQSAPLQEFEAILRRSAIFMIDQFNHGHEGTDFRDWFITREGFNTWLTLKQKVGPKMLFESILTQETMLQMMQIEDDTSLKRLEVFIDRMFESPKPEDEDNEQQPNGEQAV